MSAAYQMTRDRNDDYVVCTSFRRPSSRGNCCLLKKDHAKIGTIGTLGNSSSTKSGIHVQEAQEHNLQKQADKMLSMTKPCTEVSYTKL